MVPQAEWLAARKELLRKEKEFSRLRDELSRQRRALPWERVEKNYVFDGPEGKETLADLFAGRSQLVVYHFMFGPGWKEGCPSCSFLADGFDGAAVHLAHRDVTFLAISRATLPEIEAFKKRMGWRFKWVSSFANDFNLRLPRFVFEGGAGQGQGLLQLRPGGVSVRRRPGHERVLQERGGRNLSYLFQLRARTGSDADDVPVARSYAEGARRRWSGPTMAWVRHHDKYIDGEIVDVKALYVQPAKTMHD